MQDQGVGFLDSSTVGVGDDDFQIGFAPGLAATFPQESDRFYALALRGSERPENVWGIPARRKTDEQIIRVGQTLDLPRENLVEAVVIANAGEQGAIGHEADSGERGPMIPKVTDQFLSEVHGVSGAASIATCQDLAAGLEGGDGCGGNLLKRTFLSGQIFQRAAGVFNQLGQNGFHACILAVVTAGAKGKKPALESRIAASITISSCRKILLEFFMGVGFHTTCRWDGS